MTAPDGRTISEIVLNTAVSVNGIARELCRTVLRLTKGHPSYSELRERVKNTLVFIEENDAWHDHIRRTWTCDSDPVHESEVEGIMTTDAQFKTLMHAVAKAKRRFGTDLDAVALEHICAAFVRSKA